MQALVQTLCQAEGSKENSTTNLCGCDAMYTPAVLKRLF